MHSDNVCLHICNYFTIPEKFACTQRHSEASRDQPFSSRQISFYLQYSVPVNTEMLTSCVPILSISGFINQC